MSLIHSASIVMLVGMTTPLASGEGHKIHMKDVTIDELKKVYLSCDHAVMAGQLNSGGIMQCSVVYEELKRRAFDGDFEKLLAWARSHPPVRSTADRPASMN